MSELVADWTTEAEGVLGRGGLKQMLRTTFDRSPAARVLTTDELEASACQVVLTVSEQRSTWTRWNVYAETERVLRDSRFPSPEEREAATEAVVARATGSGLSIRISEPELVVEPDVLRRASDGQSVFVPHGAERYTTSRILAAEEFLVEAAVTRGTAVAPLVAEAALAVHESTTGVALDDGQRELVDYFATHPALLSLGIGPAGAGKTTAMRALADIWAADGRRIVPLASSAKAAQVLGDELGLRTENLHKFLHEQKRLTAQAKNPADAISDSWFRLDSGDVVLVDEASLAGTLQLAQLVTTAKDAGAVVRLLGDPAQLSAVEADGALRLLETEVGAVHLDQLHRFRDADEASATSALRRGDPTGLNFYETHDRIRAGTREAMLESAYDAWTTDILTGHTSILIAATGADVTALNTRARTERIHAGHVNADPNEAVDLRDGNRASVGDWVVTRTNMRSLTWNRGRDWVKNGDSWTITAHHRDGSVTVQHRDHRGSVRLPIDYVVDSLELAYASTAHRVQGITVDTAHTLITPEMTREALYVASTRARTSTHWYAVTEHLLEAASHHEPELPTTAHDLLTSVLVRTSDQDSAITTIRTTRAEATSLPTLIERYQHAWSHAASEALRTTANTALSPDDASRLLNDPGAGQLARTLADASSRGANPTEVLSAAIDYDTLAGVGSTCLVLASRIQDHPTTLGVPRTESVDRPLPWLPGPDAGHPAWNEYLSSRARLIVDRAHQLGSLANAYREQYHLTHLPNNDLGAPPNIGGQQRAAYQAVLRSLDRDVVPGARSEGQPGRTESLPLPGAPSPNPPEGPICSR